MDADLDRTMDMIMNMLFVTIFVAAATPFVIEAIARAVPAVSAGSAQAMPQAAVYGQQWIDPYTGRTYVYAPVRDPATFDAWTEASP